MKISSTEYLQVWQALNVGNAQISKITLCGCKISDTGTQTKPSSRFVMNANYFEPHHSAVLNVTQSTISVSNCVFAGNKLSIVNISQSSLQVHGIFMISRSNLNISESHFLSNKGGCFHLIKTALYIQSSIFHKNDAGVNEITKHWRTTKRSRNKEHPWGVVVFASGSNISVVGSNFTSNSADSGAIMILTSRSTSIMGECQFISNHAKHSGGVVLAKDSSNVQISSSCVFHSNYARQRGGVVLASDHVSIKVNFSSFTNNTAGWQGGVFDANQDSSVSVESCNFTRNRAAKHSGVFLLRINVSAIVVSSSFTNNTAKYGGVIFAQAGSSVSSISSGFSHNSAGKQGGVLCVRKKVPVTVVFSMFANNSANYGAVVFAEKHSFVSANSSDFVSNNAHVLGVLVAFENVTVVVVSSGFSKNTAEQGGVFFAQKESSMYFKFSHFIRNEALAAGGVMVSSYLVGVTVVSSSFINNTAQQGAVIYAERGSSVSFCSSVFLKNIADDFGGVMIAYTNVIVSVVSCSFTGNTAGWQGGVIDAQQGSTISVDSSDFLSNWAGRYGGVVFSNRNIRVVVMSSSFTENTALFGGTFLADASSVSVGSSYFLSNNAYEVGGVASLFGESALQMSNSTCESNKARKYASVMRAVQSALHLHLVLFVNNQGTAVVSHGIADVNSTLSDCTFENNFQNQSKFGNDLFFENPVILQNIKVTKDWAEGPPSIVTMDETVIVSLKIIVHFGKIPTVVIVNHLLWRAMNDQNIEIVCPEYAWPKSSTAGMSETEVSLLQLTCDFCPHTYYIGENSTTVILMRPTRSISDYSCTTQNKSSFPFNSIFVLCESNVEGECYSCPYGANCSTGISALANYWGSVMQDGQIHMQRCPQGYCCPEETCPGINSCSDNREGTLCGRCRNGFSEAILSETCIEKSQCGDLWFLWTCVAWVLLAAIIIIVLKDIKVFFVEVLKTVKSLPQKSKAPSCSSSMNRVTESEHSDESDKTQCRKKKLSHYKISKEKLNIFAKVPKETRHKGIVQVSKVQEFFDDDTKKAGSLKYLQILLFNIQDISLLQINISNPIAENQSAVSKYIFYLSEWAIDMIQFGKNICFWTDMTPVEKVVLKSLLGPSILLLYAALSFAFFLSTKFGKERTKLQKHVYTRLASAAVFVLLLCFQKIAKATLSLIHCVQVGDRYVLLLDGTISCYQTWQLGVFAFLLTWVIPFILVLTIGPGLLSDNRISAPEFLVSCSFPVPILLWWAYKGHRNQWDKTERLITPWHAELVEDLQKSFKKISVTGIGPVCWTGVIKCRRLVLVLMYTFISNLVLRLCCMTVFTLFILLFHNNISPYKDRRANQLFSFSLISTIILGLLNLIKAVVVEGLVDYGIVRSIVEACDSLTDIVLLWFPLSVILVYALFLLLKKILSNRKLKECSICSGNSVSGDEIQLKEQNKKTSSFERAKSI